MSSTGEPFGLFWNSDNGDRTYDASSFEYWLKKFFTSGVFNGDMQVKASSGMTLTVDPGYCNVDGKVKFWNAIFNVTLSAANSTYPRIDTIVITRDNVNREIKCEVVTGSYSADAPQPTAPVRNGEIYQLVLAQVYVGAGVTEIVQSNITDTRADNTICGYITGTVEELDFSAFTTQFEAYFAEFKATKMADFSAWELAQEAAYAAWFGLVQQQQIQDKADWDAWYAALQEELHELPEDTAEYLQIEIDELRESGMSGSILHITTTESTLESKTVTVTGDYNNEERTATFDSNLECTIMGIKSVGDITIESSDGIDTATKVIQVPYYGNYDVEIAFWAATVNIQGDENLYGATVTVKDSNNTTVGTVTLNAVTGQGTFIAKAPDTYTFSATYSGETYTEELVVDEETTYSVEIKTVFNWKAWIDTSQNLDSEDYDTLDELLVDELALRELFLTHDCIDYLAAWTSADNVIEAILENDLSAKWINNSDYALDFLGANTALKDVMDEVDKYGYGEWCLMPQVPKMTANNAPYGEAIASGYYSGSYANYMAFDGDPSTRWAGATNTANQYCGYHFISPILVTKVYWKASASINHKAIVKGSNDGSTWVAIGEEFDVVENSDGWVDLSENTTAYSYFAVFNTEASEMSFYTLQFYLWQPKGNVPVMTGNTAPYGEVIFSETAVSGGAGYYAFDDNPSTTWAPNNTSSINTKIGYKFTNPTCVKRVRIESTHRSDSIANRVHTAIIEGSNDGTNWTEIQTLNDVENAVYHDITNSNYYLYYYVHITATTGNARPNVAEIQFYGRELKVSVPKMTSNTAPFGEVSAKNNYGTDYPWKAFDGSDSTLWSAENASSDTSNEVYLDYYFTTETCIKEILYKTRNMSGYVPSSIDIKYYDEATSSWKNGGTVTPSQTIGDTSLQAFSVNNSNSAKKWRALFHVPSRWVDAYTFQFYGLDYSEKEFEPGTTKKWLYDHGVELVDFNFDGYSQANNTFVTPIKYSDHILTDIPAGSYVSNAAPDLAIDLTPYSWARCKAFPLKTPYNNNLQILGTKQNTSLLGGTTMVMGVREYALDISNIDQQAYPGIRLFGLYQSGSSYPTAPEATELYELWLEP